MCILQILQLLSYHNYEDETNNCVCEEKKLYSLKKTYLLSIYEKLYFTFFSAFLPIAIHTVNRIQVRELSFIMRNTLMKMLAPGVNGTKGTYSTIEHQSYNCEIDCSGD